VRGDFCHPDPLGLSFPEISHYGISVVGGLVLSSLGHDAKQIWSCVSLLLGRDGLGTPLANFSFVVFFICRIFNFLLIYTETSIFVLVEW
jgi:hypothetical protein